MENAMLQGTLGPHRPVDDHLADEDRATHVHRNDLTTAMVAADPRFTADKTENVFYDELARCYGDQVADRLWGL